MAVPAIAGSETVTVTLGNIRTIPVNTSKHRVTVKKIIIKRNKINML